MVSCPQKLFSPCPHKAGQALYDGHIECPLEVALALPWRSGSEPKRGWRP